MVPGIEELIVGIAAMDRDEAFKLLKGGEDGIREWNQRRRADEAIPDPSGADLSPEKRTTAIPMTMNLTHGYNHSTRQEYPLDAERVWDHWRWTPGPEWDRNNP